jgi:Domain of unknown function (DUF222)
MYGAEVEGSGADGSAPAALAPALLEQVCATERVIRAAQADQVRAAVDFIANQRGVEEVCSELVERATAMELAGALGCSMTSARMYMADAEDLVRHHPTVLESLARGEIALWVARQIVSGTRVLDAPSRGLIDHELANEAAVLLPGQVREMVDRRVSAIDAEAAARRARAARADREVFVLKRPDTMAMLGANLPAEQAAACYASLDRDARSKRAGGDGRTLAHIMCDTLVERVTGAQAATEAATVELQVVMTDAALLGSDATVSELVGSGAIPTELAVELNEGSLGWVRRLLTDPMDATVVTADTRRRRFDGPLRDFIITRDRRCRQPMCGARIRDVDHRREFVRGGRTDAANGDGYCERCHYLRDHPGVEVAEDRIGGPAPPDAAASDGAGIVWTGPSGRRYSSLAPPGQGVGSATPAQLEYRRSLIARARRDALRSGPPVDGTAVLRRPDDHL